MRFDIKDTSHFNIANFPLDCPKIRITDEKVPNSFENEYNVKLPHESGTLSNISYSEYVNSYYYWGYSNFDNSDYHAITVNNQNQPIKHYWVYNGD